jgi:hypothetical protein
MEFSKNDKDIVYYWNLEKDGQPFYHDGERVFVTMHQIENGCASRFTSCKTRYRFYLSNGQEISILASWPSDVFSSLPDEFQEMETVQAAESAMRLPQPSGMIEPHCV